MSLFDWLKDELSKGVSASQQEQINEILTPGSSAFGDPVAGDSLSSAMKVNGSAVATGVVNGSDQVLGLPGGLASNLEWFLGSNPIEQRKFEAEQAALEREWQTEMSNTAYQRSVADMKAAGLNPILAYSQGGATSGIGASASASSAGNTPGIIRGISGLIQTIGNLAINAYAAGSSSALKASQTAINSYSLNSASKKSHFGFGK